MKSLDKNLAFLFGVMCVLILALYYGEHHFPMDGQIFQVIANLLTAAGATFFAAARHTFGIPEDKSDSKQKPVEQNVTVEQNITAPPGQEHS